MYILVAILYLNGMYKIDTQPYLYNSYADCNASLVILKDRLMATKPSPDAKALVFCAEIPKEV